MKNKVGIKDYQILKFPLGDLWFLAPKKLTELNGWFEMMCPNCFKNVCADPLEMTGRAGKQVRYIASFVRIKYRGTEFKILSCPKKCGE